MSVADWIVHRRRSALLTVVVGAAVAAGILLLPAPTPAEPVSTTGLSTKYESTVAAQRQAELPRSDVAPAVVVLSRPDGRRLDPAQRGALPQVAAALKPFALGGIPVAPPQVSTDGTVALVAVPLAVTADVEATSTKIADLRAGLDKELPKGLQAEVTGPPAITADLAAIFDGADVRLLGATVLVVAVLLLLTYRSPVLWLLPLLVVGVTEQSALKFADHALALLGIAPDPSAQGITSVLVFGAATNYALLLIARYREELRRHETTFAAMCRALPRTAEAVLASGGTVVLAVGTLLLSDTASNRAIGGSAVVGVLLAMAAALLVLPALLVLAGRRVFWPFVPRFGDAPTKGRVWGRLGAAVARRPRAVALVAAAGLLALATGTLGLQTGLTQSEQFRAQPEAIAGAQTLASAFPAGTSEPVAVLTTPQAAPQVAAAAARIDGVASARVGLTSPSTAQVDVVLGAEPGTDASDAAVRAVRSAVRQVPGADAVVGGSVAGLDRDAAAGRDARLLIPLILVLVAVVLVAVLRCLVAPAVIMLSVVTSFGAALGGSWLLLRYVLDLPPLDPLVLLLSLLFLVALGVDYSIFLVTRAREGARTSGTREGMLTAVRVTGGVITSAGIVLAAVFAVLGVLPLIVLTQIGIIVCVGVLLDTLVVRTVVVPAVAIALGDRFWWSSRLTEGATGTATSRSPVAPAAPGRLCDDESPAVTTGSRGRT